MVPHHQAGHHQQHESGPQSCFRTETLPKNEKLENEETMENKNHLPEYKHRDKPGEKLYVEGRDQCCRQGPYLRTWVCNTDLLMKRGPY